MSYTLKQLDQISPDYIRPSVEGVLSVCSNGSASLNKMAAVLINGKKKQKKKKKKKHLKSSSREPRKLQGWIQVYNIGDTRFTKLRPWGKYWKFSFSEYIKTYETYNVWSK